MIACSRDLTVPASLTLIVSGPRATVNIAPLEVGRSLFDRASTVAPIATPATTTKASTKSSQRAGRERGICTAFIAVFLLVPVLSFPELEMPELLPPLANTPAIALRGRPRERPGRAATQAR